jgi:hypothetical protein
MQSIPKFSQTIIHSSNSFLVNNYSHLSLICFTRDDGGGYVEKYQDRNLLASVTEDDDTVYDDYIATTIDSGWMLFNIAAVISVASVVLLPLNIRLGKCVSSRLEAKNTAGPTAADDYYDITTVGNEQLSHIMPHPQQRLMIQKRVIKNYNLYAPNSVYTSPIVSSPVGVKRVLEIMGDVNVMLEQEHRRQELVCCVLLLKRLQ